MSISPRALATMTRRMSDLIGGGLTMNKSLSVLGAQSEDRQVRQVLKSIHKELGNGKSFSDALRAQNGTFGPIYTGLVRAGESSGGMEGTLEELSALLESEIENRQRLRAALAYPLALLTLSIAVCFFLTVFVIPRFELLFQDLGQRLPWPTRFLVGFTFVLKSYGWILLIMAAAVSVYAVKQKNILKNRVSGWMRRAPILYEIARTAALHRWTQVMASLLRGGVTLPEALWLSRKTLDGRLFGPVVEETLVRLREGRSLSSSLAQSAFFPPMLCELVGAGEESGRVEKTFERLTQTYRRESDLKIKLALSLLEPALVLGMGLIVGFVAVAMLLPVFSMSANIR